jgi:hypothetical protein
MWWGIFFLYSGIWGEFEELNKAWEKEREKSMVNLRSVSPALNPVLRKKVVGLGRNEEGHWVSVSRTSQPCSAGCQPPSSVFLSHYFSINHQPPASQQYFSLTTNQHQPSAISQPNETVVDSTAVYCHIIHLLCSRIIFSFVLNQTRWSIETSAFVLDFPPLILVCLKN